MSLSARRAWIEILRRLWRHHQGQSRSPQGERGLKYLVQSVMDVWPGRSPQGERGLKYRWIQETEEELESLSARRAWIEIFIMRGQK